MTKIIFNDFARNLKQLRKKRDWSQQELADKVGVSKQSIFNYENNKKTPSQDTLEKIAQVLKVSQGFLLSGTQDLLDSLEFDEGTPEHEYAQAREYLAFDIGRRALVTKSLENSAFSISDLEYFLDIYEVPSSLVNSLNYEEKINYLKFIMNNQIEKSIKQIEKTVIQNKVFDATYGWDYWDLDSKKN